MQTNIPIFYHKTFAYHIALPPLSLQYYYVEIGAVLTVRSNKLTCLHCLSESCIGNAIVKELQFKWISIETLSTLLKRWLDISTSDIGRVVQGLISCLTER